jgi:hypothetical protein
MIVALAGCTTFDWAVFPGIRTDAYTLDYGVVPDELVEEVAFEAEDGTTLYGAWLHQDPPAPPMIFFHGYYGNLDHPYNSEWAEYYWTFGTYDVFTIDYRGYGRSEGTPDGDVFWMDGVAAVDHVVATTGVEAASIPITSVSLGSAVAVHTNVQRRAQVLIVDSMFADAEEVLDDSVGLDLYAGWFFSYPFDNVAAIADIQDPALIIHGTADTFVSPDNVYPVYAAAPEPKDLWQPVGVGHADGYAVIPREYRERVEGWIAQHGGAP